MREKSVTRSSFVRGAAMGAVGAAILSITGRASAGLDVTASAPGGLFELWTQIPGLLESHLDWPGVAAANEWLDAATPKGLEPEQETLLRGALLLQLEHLVGLAPKAAGASQIEHALSQRMPVDRLSTSYFASVLAEVEERSAQDPAFAARIADAAKRADQLDDHAEAVGFPRLTFPEIGFIVVCVICVVAVIILL